jgi:gluconolactonase
MKWWLPAICVVATAQLPEVVVQRSASGYHFLNAPVWAPEDALLFSDVPTDRVLRYAPGKKVTEDAVHAGGVSAMTFDTQGRLYFAEPHSRRVTRQDKQGKSEILAEQFEGKRLNAPNDIVVRRDGNVYFTDPAFGAQQDARELDFYGVFRISPRGELTVVARWKTRPNGIALTEDGRMLFVADSDAQSVHAFDLDRGGVASNDRVVIASIPGAPAGLRTDVTGNLYVAARDVFVYSPKYALLRTIHVDETPANLTWGDADLQSLYVTARTSLYHVRVGVKGAVPYLP